MCVCGVWEGPGRLSGREGKGQIPRNVPQEEARKDVDKIDRPPAIMFLR